MLCILSFIVLAVLGIFSARHREMAVEAFDCVTRTVRREPCDTGFDQRVKASVTARLMRCPWLARLWRRHAETIALMIIVVLAAVVAVAAGGLYNLAVHGTCTPTDPGSCTITALQNGTAGP